MDNTNNDALSLYEAAMYLGISCATLRNWIRLGKARPLQMRPPLFAPGYIENLHKSLDSSTALKKRRNKSRISKGFIPKSYIDNRSPNYPLIIDLLSALAQENISPIFVISFYAKKLLSEAGTDPGISKKLLSQPGLTDNTRVSETEKKAIETLLSSCPISYVPSEDTLGMLYISLKLIRQKKSQGAYYTPFYVVDRVLETVRKDLSSEKAQILDPACGTGNFLLRLPMSVSPDSIYGTDIDETAVAIARINLSMKYGITDQTNLDKIFNNVRTDNFLMPCKKDTTDDTGQDSEHCYDVILGNPPWGFSFSLSEAAELDHIFSSYTGTGNPESFDLFVEQSLRHMRQGAVMAFLLPETILGADIHAPIRQYILENAEVVSITYLGEAFDKVQCPSIILALKKKSSPPGTATALDNDSMEARSNSDRSYKIRVSFEKTVRGSLKPEKSFAALNDRISASSFHILSDSGEYEILEKMHRTPHFTLKGNAVFCLGIVTGSNRTLIKSEASEGLEPILKGKDIVRFGITEPESYISYTPEKFQQCAPTELYRNSEKLFYRFIADEPVFALDRDSLLSLNSANIVIPRVADYSVLYILAVLNSSSMSFYYKKSFKGMKVLRSALESLPIPLCDEKARREISQIADALSFSELSGIKKPENFDVLRETLDRKVASLFGLSAQEYEMTLKD